MATRTPNKHVMRACGIVGSQVKLATILKVTRAAVGQWANGDRPVPVGRCPTIEMATNGRVRCEQLRPDVAWSVLLRRQS